MQIQQLVDTQIGPVAAPSKWPDEFCLTGCMFFIQISQADEGVVRSGNVIVGFNQDDDRWDVRFLGQLVEAFNDELDEFIRDGLFGDVVAVGYAVHCGVLRVVYSFKVPGFARIFGAFHYPTSLKTLKNRLFSIESFYQLLKQIKITNEPNLAYKPLKPYRA